MGEPFPRTRQGGSSGAGGLRVRLVRPTLVTRVLAGVSILVLGCAALADDSPPAVQVKPAVAPAVPNVRILDREAILRPDGRMVVFYRVNFVSPAVLKAELAKWLDPVGGAVDVSGAAIVPAPHVGFKGGPAPGVAVQNMLRIEVPQEHWPDIRSVLEMIDVPEPQVLVEAKIVEVTHTDEFRSGLLLAEFTRTAADTFFRGVKTSFPNSLEAVGGSTLTFGYEDKFQEFDYIFQLAETGADAKVHSHPQVVASQGEVARIQVVDKEPITEQTIRSNVVTATTVFQEVGLILEVQPLFIGRDHVRAHIRPELSRVSQFRTTSTSSDVAVVNPVIATRSADTVVTVPDGETVVIAGLVADAEQDERSGLPVLKDLPLVGGLFGSTTRRKLRTELVFFITLTIRRPMESRLIVPPSELERIGE